jgi:hypothetical protein
MFNRQNNPYNKPKSSAIKDLYPDLSPDELSEAEHALHKYLALVWRIYQRLRRESSEKQQKFDGSFFKR